MDDRIAPDAAVLLIGLGRFGTATAEQLARQERDVLAIDVDAELVQRIADRVTHAVQADASDIDALRQVAAQDFQIAVVAVGSDIESSVLITSNLIDLGVRQIWAKAVSAPHGKILERIGAHHVVYPEAEAGERVAHLVSGKLLDFIRFDDGFALVKMRVPEVASGVRLMDAGFRKRFGVTIVGVKPQGESFTYASADTVLHAGDIVIASGSAADLDRFASHR